MAPDYENLMLLQKVEVFEYALENTTGQDLYRVLWLKSTNSEHWLERRAELDSLYSKMKFGLDSKKEEVDERKKAESEYRDSIKSCPVRSPLSIIHALAHAPTILSLHHAIYKTLFL